MNNVCFANYIKFENEANANAWQKKAFNVYAKNWARLEEVSNNYSIIYVVVRQLESCKKNRGGTSSLVPIIKRSDKVETICYIAPIIPKEMLTE